MPFELPAAGLPGSRGGKAFSSSELHFLATSTEIAEASVDANPAVASGSANRATLDIDLINMNNPRLFAPEWRRLHPCVWPTRLPTLGPRNDLRRIFLRNCRRDISAKPVLASSGPAAGSGSLPCNAGNIAPDLCVLIPFAAIGRGSRLLGATSCPLILSVEGRCFLPKLGPRPSALPLRAGFLYAFWGEAEIGSR